MTTYTDARAKAIKKYLKTMGEAKIRAPKEDMDRYKARAEEAEISFNQFAIDAIEEKIRREKHEKKS